MGGKSGASASDRTFNLFAPEDVAETEVPDLTGEVSDGSGVRIVNFPILNERPCLVRCGPLDRSLKQIRELSTICGRPCKDAISTTRRPPAGNEYCAACLSGAGRSVLR